MKAETKFCKDCSNQMQAKPLNKCSASKYHDPVDGTDKRACMIERLDGIGRCGIMANNFSPKGPKPVKVRTNPMKPVEK